MCIEGEVGCADCGFSATVERIVKHIDLTTEKQVHALDFANGCALAVGLYIVMALIDGLVIGGLGFAVVPGEAGEPVRNVIGVTCLLLSIIMPLALSLAITKKVNKTFSQALEVSAYHCTHCGDQCS